MMETGFTQMQYTPAEPDCIEWPDFFDFVDGFDNMASDKEAIMDICKMTLLDSTLYGRRKIIFELNE